MPGHSEAEQNTPTCFCNAKLHTDYITRESIQIYRIPNLFITFLDYISNQECSHIALKLMLDTMLLSASQEYLLPDTMLLSASQDILPQILPWNFFGIKRDLSYIWLGSTFHLRDRQNIVGKHLKNVCLQLSQRYLTVSLKFIF